MLLFLLISFLLSLCYFFSLSTQGHNRKARGGMSLNLINVDGEDAPYTSSADVVMVSSLSCVVCLCSFGLTFSPYF